MVRCSDATLIDRECDYAEDLSTIVGALVLVIRDEQGQVASLKFVE